ncbi:hypothetical protein HMPREF9057_02390 [Actinomyces sp. oral taxon 171 str. F0337]|nr:hypothetical protein HMPREF9057_02390 [Actinomyces sp. oral taxon 171 str. F0337]
MGLFMPPFRTRHAQKKPPDRRRRTRRTLPDQSTSRGCRVPGPSGRVWPAP